MALTRETDELEKRITAALLGDVGSILLDNVTRLAAPSLAAALTTDLWCGRLLGRSQLVHVPNKALWLATGNNVSLSDEMVRRVVSIRLDAGVARPEERTGFKHRDLRAWTLGRRTQLVSACLSLVEHWRREGSPAPSDGATLGRYESWCSVIGGILETIGLPGFLSGRDRLYEQADRESREWSAFSASWWDAHAGLPVTAKDIFAIAKSKHTLLDIWGGRNELSAMQRFGHAVHAKRDRIFGDYVILSAGNDAQTGNAAYRLEKLARQRTPETPEIPEVSGHTGETSQDESGVSGVSGVRCRANFSSR
jgi:hypothetical protein